MRKPRSRKAGRGVTLIELLVAMSISIIVSVVIAAVFASAWRSQVEQEAYGELQRKGRLAIDEISAAVRIASGVAESVSSGGNNYTTTSSSIVLETPAIDADNDILPETDYFVFRLNPTNSTNLERIIIADPASSRTGSAGSLTLNDKTASLVFSYFDGANSILTPGTDDLTAATSVHAEVDSQQTVRGRIISRFFENRVYLRNKE